jgi:glycosyltransferase involved in cell wall biosynthesis
MSLARGQMAELNGLGHATSDSVAFGPSPKASVPVASMPRVLIYSNEFPQTGSAGGILLDRLFQDYPPNRVRIVGPAPQPASAPSRFRHHQVRMPWSRFEGSRFNRLHRSLRGFGFVPLQRPDVIDGLLGSFQPEVVLTIMQHGTWYDAVMRYAKERKLPLVTIIHDDNEGFDKVYWWARKARRKRDGAFYRSGSRRLCVSAEMEHEFQRRYGVPGEVLYPNRSEDLGPRDPEMNASLRTPGRLTIGFVGNPNYGYGEQLVKMLPALREAKAKLVAYGHAPRGAAAPLVDAGDVVELRGFVRTPEEAWQGIKDYCDVLIFPYLDPPGAMEQMYSIHFPSKLPEYLAAGMPIVMVGPESATGVRWARRHPRAVYLVDSSEPKMWSADLERLASDAELRSSLAAGAVEAGSLEFDPLALRNRFQSVLLETAQTQTSR